MSIDDAYTVEQVLAQTKSGMTEIVTLDGTGPFIRKRVFHKFAHRSVWAALSECSCPRLPHVQASYETPDTFVVVCSYIPGQTLTEYMAGRESLTDQEATRIIENVCEAVAELHRHSVIHCDITPENIIIAADGAHVIDLGIACMEYEGTSSESAKLGTWGFAAPEQYGFANVDKRTDIYSIGRLFAYLLTGARPDSDSFESAMRQLEQEKPHFYQTIKRASCFEPSGRYQSIAAFAEDIHRPHPSETAKPSMCDNAHEETHSFRNNDSSRQKPKTKRDKDQGGWKKKIALTAAVCACFAAIGFRAIPLDSPEGPDNDQTEKEAVESQKVEADEEASIEAEDSPQANEGQSVLEGDTAEFSVSESEWHVSSTGHIQYTIGVRNDSDSTAIKESEILITGRDKNGKVVFTDEQPLGIISPESTVYFSSLTGDEIAPETIEFKAGKATSFTWKSQYPSEESYKIVNEGIVRHEKGYCSFTGEVQANPDVRKELEANSPANDVCVTVVFRDKTGAVIGGWSTFVDAPKEDELIAFQVQCYDTPEFDSYEIHADPWLH